MAAALQVGPVAVGLGGESGGTGRAVPVLDISPRVNFGGKGGGGQLEVTYHGPELGEVRPPAKDFFKNVVHVTLPARLAEELERA
ncbi:MAG: hypothetical protein FJY99_05700 [Candidatus Sericytochromatia bacterium]|nr:hypothetical protein [Candidatus Tanganyikabacteria bacterium]